MFFGFWFTGYLFLLILQPSIQQENATEEIEIEPNQTDCSDSPRGVMEDLVQVKTFLGSITGRKLTTHKGTNYYTFKGIPFAQPPVGSLRFKPPVTGLAWKHLDALQFRPKCPQLSVFTGEYEGEEDCLYLNIYTPSLPESPYNKSTLRPVMVWIHGGGFVNGAGSEYNPVKLVKKDVVVVTVNYRLSSLGFLNFGNSLVEGNMGIRDQIEALRWIQEYIFVFGGDPRQVTLFGESAGGVSVHTLYLSPLAAGLFSSAIAQSGTALLWKHQYEASRPSRIAQQLAEVFDCPSEGLDSIMLSCLQDIRAEDLIANTTEDVSLPTYKWWPTMDSYAAEPVTPVDPHTTIKLGMFDKLPLMTGTVKNEAEGSGIGGFFQNISASDWKVVLADTLGLAASSNHSEITDTEHLLTNIAEKYYLGNNYSVAEKRNELNNLFTDAMFLSPDQEVAELMSRDVHGVYNYHLTFTDQLSFATFFGSEDSSLAPVHGDDLFYFFCGIEDEKFNLTESESILSEKMLAYWTNFAKFGNPSPNSTDNLEPWLPYLNDKNYLELKPVPEMKKNIKAEEMLLWKRLIWN